jgi:23S rRNA (pseudouridine1915-N3)-methyltransferase
MKLHIVTIGEPKLPYAKQGWADYIDRLGHYHTVKTTHLADKYATDVQRFQQSSAGTFVVVLEITGKAASSPALADFLEKQAQTGREVSFVIGGPEGLPQAVIDSADYQLSLSTLTLPHDLAMVVLAEALYRASTINANQKYHK